MTARSKSLLCAGAVLFAVLYQVPKKVVGEGILLIDHDRLTQVRALGTGRLVRLNVKLIKPPSVPTASAILTAGTDPASSSIIVPVAEDAAPMV